MKKCVSFVQKDGKFTIEFENGQVKRGSANQSYSLHNLLCFSRLEAPLTRDQNKRLGWAGATAYAKEFFSTAWNYYLEAGFTQINMKGLIKKFNNACDRDFNSGYIDSRIKISSLTRLDRETLKITLDINSSQTSFTIKI